MITIEEVRKLAVENYENGGDVVYECFEDYQIEERFRYEEYHTAEGWLELFRFYKSMENEF